jgi:hypothetical protein
MYSLQLRDLHSRCLNNNSFGKDLLGYSEFIPGTSIGGLLPPLSLPAHRISSMSKSVLRNEGNLSKNNQPNHPSNKSKHSSRATDSSITKTIHSHHNLSAPIAATASSGLNNVYVSPRGNTHPTAAISGNVASDQFSGFYADNIGNARVISTNSAAEPVEDELITMSNILLGQQFLEMDRVISFHGTDFDYRESSGW